MGGLSLCHMLKDLSARSAASWAGLAAGQWHPVTWRPPGSTADDFSMAWPEASGQTWSMHRAPSLQGWVLLLAAFWVDHHSSSAWRDREPTGQASSMAAASTKHV